MTQSESLSSKYILAFDADCGPCTRFRHVVDILDMHQKINFISLIEADQKGLLNSIADSLRHKSFHLILPNGEVKSGSEALLALIAILPGGRVVSPIINYFPGGKRIVHVIYTTISKLHDRASCSIGNNNRNNND